MQEADRDALDALAPHQPGGGADGGLVEREQDVALVVQAFRDGQAQVARHQGLGQAYVEVVLVVAALVAEGEDVAEARRREQRRARALALDDRIRRERRPVHHGAQRRSLDARPAQYQRHAVQDAALGRRRRGQDLHRKAALATALKGDVCEGSSDVRGESRLHGRSVPPLPPRRKAGHGAA